MLNLKRDMLSVALASAIMAMAAQAQAQAQAATEEDEEAAKAEEAKQLDAVEVTSGIRRGIEDAIENKQNASSIVESISAEDIGKLPDQSIADSIARLPGLTAARNAKSGRAQEINVRGLSGDFSTTTLNGREQVSLSNSRSVEFDQYPSELIGSVLVYKTPDASLIGQGLSATIDLRTVRPLDFDDTVSVVGVRYEQSRLAGDTEPGNRINASYIDQNDDKTFGFALGYARLNSSGQGREFGAWGYDGSGLLEGGKLYDYLSENRRDGFMATLEFKPSDAHRSILDFYYSRSERDEDRRGMEFGLADWTSRTVNRRVNTNGTATQFDMSGVNPIVLRNDYNSLRDDLMAIGWKHEFKPNEDWTLTADLSTSSGDRDERILETYAGTPGNRDTVSARYDAAGFFGFDFGIDYANPSQLRLYDVGGWGGGDNRAQAGYLKDFQIEDSLHSARFDAQRAFSDGAISAIRFGLNYAEREKSRGSDENTLCLSASCLASNNVQVAIPTSYLGAPVTLLGGQQMIALDPRAMLAGGVYRLLGKDNSGIANKNWEVNEQVISAYFQGDIDAQLGSIAITGNAGVQVQRTDQDSSGFRTYSGNAVGDPVTEGASYTDVLPSLNLRFSLAGDQMLRFGAAKQVARARLDDLRASQNFEITNGSDRPDNRLIGQIPIGANGRFYRGSGGNPALRPWEANAYDLSYEKYFDGTRGYVSVAYFFKDLKTYIYDRAELRDFTGFPIPPGTPQADLPTSRIGQFNQPVNGEGGLLKGWELSASVPFDLLWEPLRGFGMQAAYTDTTTSVSPNGPGRSEPLPGFSKYTSNATLYYENAGFSTRVSRRTRSAFRTTFQGFGGDLQYEEYSGEAIVDAQVAYTFQSGSFEGLTLLLQGSNLTDETSRARFGSRDDRPKAYFEYGKYYLFGASYKF